MADPLGPVSNAKIILPISQPFSWTPWAFLRSPWRLMWGERFIFAPLPGMGRRNMKHPPITKTFHAKRKTEGEPLVTAVWTRAPLRLSTPTCRRSPSNRLAIGDTPFHIHHNHQSLSGRPDSPPRGLFWSSQAMQDQGGVLINRMNQNRTKNRMN